jgi:hypothetical protein
MWNIAHLYWCNWRKNTTGRSPRGIDLAWHCPSSPGACNPEETGLPGLPLSWLPTLFSGSGPVRLPPVSWTEITIDRSPFWVVQDDAQYRWKNYHVLTGPPRCDGGIRWCMFS